jgi:glycosyltransferase involved in cell wall biosynthesis
MSAVQLSVDASAVPEQPAGAGRYVIELVSALSERDDVAVAVLTRTGDGGRWARPGPDGDRVRVAAVAPVRRPLRLAWEQLRLPSILGDLAPDVHHGPHYTMPERSPIPAVVTVHDCTYFEHPEWHERSKVWLFRRAIRVAARRAGAVICVSATTAGRLERWCAPRVPVHVIPHGVDHDRFKPGAGETEADLAVLARAGVAPPYVAFVGTIEPRKDVPTLVRAFDSIASRFPDVSLVVAGGNGWGRAPAELDAAVGRAAHAARIVRTGYLADELVPPLLRQAAVVAYPSVDEGFGLPALEAMACGSPLVTTSGTAMAEVAGNAAVLVPPGDAAALAGAIESLLAGDTGQPARTARGLEIAAAHTWTASAAAHAAVYAGVCGRR